MRLHRLYDASDRLLRHKGALEAHLYERERAHLFISVLAHHLVHTIRWRLKAHGIDQCWATLRAQLARQRRVTATLTDRDGSTWHIRQAMRPEPDERAIFDAPGLDHHPGATRQQRVA